MVLLGLWNLTTVRTISLMLMSFWYYVYYKMHTYIHIQTYNAVWHSIIKFSIPRIMHLLNPVIYWVQAEYAKVNS